MADIKLGSQVFEGVEKVKFDTVDGGTITFEKPTDLTPLVEQIEALGGTVDTVDIEHIMAACDALADPWEWLPKSGTDLLGDYEEVKVSDTPNIHGGGYLRLKKGYPDVLLYPPQAYGQGFDFTELRSNTHIPLGSYKLVVGTALIQCNSSSRVILPDTYPQYRMHTGTLAGYTLCNLPPVALYLSRTALERKPGSNWIQSNTSSNVVEQMVKCPKDMEIPYYLNKMTAITVESMVGLFENLIDNSNGDTTLTLTLGTTNLEKLTEEQKNIAYAKGWNLA